jgi:hypothetical protein
MGTPAPDAVKRLVDHFDQNRKVFLSPDYKEEQLRAEFLNAPCMMIRHSDFLWPLLCRARLGLCSTSGTPVLSEIKAALFSPAIVGDARC